MYTRPDYTTARAQAGFSWHVSGSQGALRELTGIPIREFNLNPEACIETFRRGRPPRPETVAHEVGDPGVSTPAVSYGHVNALGSELLFPEGGEVAHTHVYGSLEEGVRRLREPVEWAEAGMAPFFLQFRERLREAFPGEAVGLSFGAEGPITTAYELRGQDFYMDVLDDPPLAREFLRATVDSIVEFHGWLCSLDGREPVNPNGAGMCDDCAAFIPPRLFPEMVVPFWEQYYEGMTTGRRSAHVESLRAEQLPFLEAIGLSSFDPSISPHLNPQIVAGGCRVPFSWRLACFHYREMSCQDVEDFVFQSAADGASGVHTVVAETMCHPEGVAKVHAFMRAAKEAKRLIGEGIPREELRRRVSSAGRETLWEGWCGYLGSRSSRAGRPR